MNGIHIVPPAPPANPADEFYALVRQISAQRSLYGAICDRIARELYPEKAAAADAWLNENYEHVD
jgi:hypothetical protein